MPIYDFECTSCRFKAELMRKISEPSQTACPKCDKETFVKMLSAPSFQLSGSGWYASDFKDKNSKISDKSIENNTEKADAKTLDANNKTVPVSQVTPATD